MVAVVARVAVTCLVAALIPGTALPADSEQPTSTYPASYFADLNVMTAKDMVNRIPGSEAQLAVNPSGGGGAGRRGLRSKTDLLLVNGKRFTGKQNEADTFLDRLPANKVARIEVIDGLIVENESDAGARTINIVTTGEGASSGTWRAGIKWLENHRTTLIAEASLTGQVKNIAYNVGLETVPNGSLTHRYDTTYESNAAVEYGVEERKRYAHTTKLTGSTNVPFSSGTSLQFNVLFERQPRRGSNAVDEFDVEQDGSLTPVSASEEPLERTVETVELGGTLEFDLAEANRLQLLFLRTTRGNDRESKKNTLFTNGSTFQNHEIRIESAAESVVRGTWYTTDLLGGDFDIGLELAVNTLDKAVSLFVGVAPPLVQVPIPNANQVIREDRAELFANWSIAKSRLQYRFGLAAEYSEFDQQGSDVSQTRTLEYIKPSVNVSFSQNGSTRWFLTLKRDVSQLDFDDFIASIDPVDREIRAGNPDLVPETSWDLESGVERGLANDAGLFKLRLFHRWVQDVKDLVPLGEDDYQPGNLPDGRHWGAEVTVGYRFTGAVMMGAVLNGFFLWQDSETTDPFTGETREFFNQKQFDAGMEYRHDVQGFRGAYGVKWSTEGNRMRFENDRVDTNSNDDTIELFVEKRMGSRWLARLALNQVWEPESTRFRQNFEPDRTSGTISRRESRSQILRRFAMLTISGSF